MAADLVNPQSKLCHSRPYALDSAGLSTHSTRGRKIVSFVFSAVFPLINESMSSPAQSFDLDAMLAHLQAAVEAEKITPSAQEHITVWLSDPRYTEYAAQVAEHITDQKWQPLDDAFWTILPFGTGGRRGRMYPIGCNAINDRTIGESAQGLADYVKEHRPEGDLKCAIAYDTRHRSTHFAKLCAEIMVAAGFRVYFLEPCRSTPELSFLVRMKQCDCGIMVTASHNPPSDNAVKVYWSTGGQILPPHDEHIIDRVMNTQQIIRADFDEAVAEGNVVLCRDEVDQAFYDVVAAESFEGPRDAKILYTPLHGVGESAVVPVLKKAGFTEIEVYEPQRTPDGDFPNVPEHVSNPENPAIFEEIVPRAREIDADLILATDPDCDRMGCSAPETSDRKGPWRWFSGNQIGALLADYLLGRRKEAGTLSADHYVVKTLVTTEMIRRIADSYGVATAGNLLVGFKYIGGEMESRDAEKFLFGAEESHGYLAGQYARDKDGALACMMMAELAAQVKAEGITLAEKLDALFWQHGYFAERLVNLRMTGSEGMVRMQSLMKKIRTDPPLQIGGMEVIRVRDYLQGTMTNMGAADAGPVPLDAPTGNMVILDLAEEGNYVAIRPSGTEPKVKLYMFTFIAPEQLSYLEDARETTDARLDALAHDLSAFAESVE